MANNTQKVHESFAEFAQWMNDFLIARGWRKNRVGGTHYVLWNHPRGTKCSISLEANAGYVQMGIPGNSYPNLDNPSPEMFQTQFRLMVQSVMGSHGGYTRRVKEFNQAHPELDWWRA